jgi:hypothetical protein
MEVGGEAVVECFKFGQVYLDTVVDGMLEIVVGKTAESWQCSADHICVVAMTRARAHVAKYPGVITSVFVVCRVLKVSVGDNRTLTIKRYVCNKSERYISSGTVFKT